MKTQDIAKEIAEWYLHHHRQLPFRETKDPYRIWISEIMAQQTQIQQLLPYYKRWMEKWPSILHLSQATIEEVNKIWEGLGYYSRARNILKTSQILFEQYEGQFPQIYEEIIKLPGIGPYTAGAISSIAFEQPIAAIDGNVIRVLSRWMANESDFSTLNNKKILTAFIEQLMKTQPPSIITQALMEIGALVCTFRNPLCHACPLQPTCQAFARGQVDQFPFQKPKKAKVHEHYNVFIYIKNDSLLVSTNDQDGLMKGLLRLPQLPIPENPFEQTVLFSKTKHVFSHKIWHLTVFEASKPLKKLPSTKFLKLSEIKNQAWITAHKKILLDYLDE